MDRPEHLEQQMWEFVYGLLSDDEAMVIREQITADPAVARLYAEVKLRSELVAEASRLRSPAMQFSIPTPETQGGEATGLVPTSDREPAGRPMVAKVPVADADNPTPGPVTAAARDARPISIAVTLGWAISLAAVLLVGFVGYAYVKPQSPLRPVAFQTERQQLKQQQIQTMLLAPGRLQSQPANHLAVVTRSLDGDARSTPVAYRWYGEDNRVLAKAESVTNSAGILQIETPAEITDRFVRLEIRTPDDWNAAAISHTFDVDPPAWITHLSLDKPVCRPGQTVRFRTVTLTRYDLRVDHELAVAVEIHDDAGNALEGTGSQAGTDRGVRHGQFVIPSDMPDGTYRVIAYSPSGLFDPVSRPLEVRNYAAPEFRKRLDFDRDSYGPGDRVVANLLVQRADGDALADAMLQVQATVDEQIVLDQTSSTDQQGKFEVQFSLPESIGQGLGHLTIAVGDKGTDVISRQIPIQLDEFTVGFFPESGDLVASIRNRVYFWARNNRGQPVHVAGRIVDDSGQWQTDIRTERDGRGVFSLTPEPGRRYRLDLDAPAPMKFAPLLPPVDPSRWLVLDTGPGVFEAGSPLAIEVHSTICSRPVAITATCRGVVVGQQIVTADQFKMRETDVDCGHGRVELPIAEHAQGVIRVTAYDLGVQPAVPIAERLVYRRPHRKLQIQVNDLRSHYTTGQRVDLRLSVRDETGVEQAAVLGVSVVDDLLLSLAGETGPGLTTHFWLTGQIGDARDLEDADFYLDSQRPEAVRALDLLLGTQGWRRVDVPTEPLLVGAVDPSDLRAAAIALPTRTITAREAAAPLLVADNADQVRVLVDQALSALHQARESDLHRTGLTVLVGGLLVTVATLLLSLLRGAGGMRRWAPHLAAAALGVILGIFWTSAGIDQQGQLAWFPQAATWEPDGQVAEVTSFDASEEPPEELERGDAAFAEAEKLPEDLRAKPRQPVLRAEKSGESKLVDGAARQMRGAARADRDQEDLARNATVADSAEPEASPAMALPAPPAAAALPPAAPVQPSADVAMDDLTDPEGVAAEEQPSMMGPRARRMTEPPARMADAVADSPQMAGRPYSAAAVASPEVEPPFGTDKRREAAASMQLAAPRVARKYLRWSGQEGALADAITGTDDATRYWNPMAVAEPNGQYRLSFLLPERETTYRIAVDGHADGRIGSKQTEIVVRKAEP